MDESKDLQSLYKIFRILIYVAILIEFFEYAINPASLNFWNGFCSIYIVELKPGEYIKMVT